MLFTYVFLYLTVVFTSTTLGGVMVEVGMQHKAEGRLTAQRIAMFRVGSLVGGPIGGWLASYPFALAMGAASFWHLVLVPLFFLFLPEAPPKQRRAQRVDFGYQLSRTQLRIAETEKYAHVTFFFTGGREVPYVGEDRILIPSPKVATYDLEPEMSAREVTDRLVEATGEFEVREEHRATAALATAREFKPHLILLDVIMPSMDGGDLANLIRNDRLLKETPIVFLTATVSKREAGEGGLNSGGGLFLAKPVSVDHLIKCIHDHTKPKEAKPPPPS